MTTEPKTDKQPILVAWCLENECTVWVEKEEIGNYCPMDCYSEVTMKPRKMVGRLMYVCQLCLCAYREKKAYEEHEHNDCY